ncbi:CRISPR-associated endonuclease Cas1 [Desulfobacterales bacterium HSG2]|nr:CRISPR-associated endonuclease Cas1 [Desulfobacterales bacterium HSG2]
MQIVINNYGGFIRKRGECFEVRVGEEKGQEIAAIKVQSILITTSVMISSDALFLAHQHNVDVIFLDRHGNPFSRVWHSKFGSTAFIRRKQIELSENEKGLDLVKEWILEKTKDAEFLFPSALHLCASAPLREVKPYHQKCKLLLDFCEGCRIGSMKLWSFGSAFY